MSDLRSMSKVRRWKNGEIFYAENDFIRMAYTVTTDQTKLGTIGIQDDIFVEYINEQQAKLWEVECRQS